MRHRYLTGDFTLACNRSKCVQARSIRQTYTLPQYIHITHTQPVFLLPFFEKEKMNSATFAILADAGYDIYRWALDSNPIQDYDKPFFRTIGERCYTIQTTYFYIPPQLGFFSPGPCRLQGVEGCFFVKVASFSLMLYLLLGVASLSGAGAPYAFLRKAILLPLIIFVFTWILMCVVSSE